MGDPTASPPRSDATQPGATQPGAAQPGWVEAWSESSETVARPSWLKSSSSGVGPPRLIGPYILMELLGRGAMGEVWLAAHQELESYYALKLINEVQAADDDGVRRFQREVEAMAAVDRHPAIVRIHSAGVAPDGRPYYAMEYVTGRSLKDALREGLPLEEALDALEQVADGLGWVHAHGIVHRDVKPENVLLTDEGGARLTDFGLARLDAAAAADRLTRTGEIIGTPVYMAPEQLDRTRGEVGPHSDVWSLGTILYELLTGTPPYMAATSLEVYQKLMERAPIPPPSTRPRGGEPPLPALDAVCLTALQHDPARRYGDGAEFLAALRAARGGEADATGGSPLLKAVAGVAAVSLVLAALAVGKRALDRGPAPDAGPAQRVASSPGIRSGAFGPGGSDPRGSGPDDPVSAAPREVTSPAQRLAAARAQAAQGQLQQALATLGAPADEASFVRAEAQAVIRLGGPLADALALLACAEAGNDPAAATRAEALLESVPEAQGSPAAQEARARAALLRGDPDSATLAVARAAELAVDDPQARRTQARAQGLLAVRQAFAPGKLGPEREAALASAWEAVAGALREARQVERSGSAQEVEARLWAAQACAEALARHARARDEAGQRRALAAARAELAPLLARVPGQALRAARQELVQAGAGGSSTALLEAERKLAAAAAQLDPGERPALLGAVLLAASLGDAEARGWAEVWLGLVGDLPARAVLALGRAARVNDAAERQRLVAHALRLAPELPLCRWEWLALHLDAETGLPAYGRTGATLQALAGLLADAPHLWAALVHPLESAPLTPAQLEVALGQLTGDDRPTRLARALARLCAEPPQPGEAAADAAAVCAEEPACAAAQLLLAQACLVAGKGEAALEAAERARVAAPRASEPVLWSLRARAGGERLALRDVEPLLVRGYFARLEAFLSRPGRALRLPDDLGQLTRLSSGGDALDPDSTWHRRLLLSRLDQRGERLPALRAALRASCGRAYSPGAGGRDWTGEERPRMESHLRETVGDLTPLSVERGGVEALAWIRYAEQLDDDEEQAPARGRALQPALLALAAVGPWRTGRVLPPAALLDGRHLPRPRRPDGQRRPASDREAMALLPDAQELARTWFDEVARPDHLVQRVREASQSAGARPLLDPQDLLEPTSRSWLTLLGAQTSDRPDPPWRGFLEAGEAVEAHLALVREAAFRDDGDPLRAFRERIEDLSEEAVWGDAPGAPMQTLLERLVAEGLARSGALRADVAVLQAHRVDLLLRQASEAGLESERGRELLAQALEAARELDPELIQTTDAEPAWWSWLRQVRLHGARIVSGADAREPFQAALKRVVEEWGRRGASRTEWRLRAVTDHDPLRSPLAELDEDYERLLRDMRRALEERGGRRRRR